MQLARRMSGGVVETVKWMQQLCVADVEQLPFEAPPAPTCKQMEEAAGRNKTLSETIPRAPRCPSIEKSFQYRRDPKGVEQWWADPDQPMV